MTKTTQEVKPPKNWKRAVAMHAVLIIPLLGTIWALVDAIYHGAVPLFFVILSLVLYVLTGLGITVGYHRHFTHESFAMPQWLRAVFGVLAHMAWQGNTKEWCAKHFEHHEYSDEIKDPHTPYIYGNTKKTLEGFWHAHFEWLTESQPMPDNIVYRRLKDDPLIDFLDRNEWLWVSLSLVIPIVLGYAYLGTARGALLGLLWGGFVRICILHHVTWGINSVCHMWGTQPFKTRDQSRDNWPEAVLAFGEGFHNGHHAFPWSPVHGIRHPNLDSSWLLIRTLGTVGLTWDYKNKVPTQRQIERKMRAA